MFSCNLWQNDQGLSRDAAVTQGWNRYPESAQKFDLGEEKTPSIPAENQTRDLKIMRLPWYHSCIISQPEIRLKYIYIWTNTETDGLTGRRDKDKMCT